MINKNFTTSGQPTFEAIVGVKALDIHARVIWEQKRMPNGTSWKIIKTNIDLDSDYVKEGFENLYVPTQNQQDALNNAHSPTGANPLATLSDILYDYTGDVWWVKASQTVVIPETRDNVVSTMQVDGTLTIQGKLTIL